MKKTISILLVIAMVLSFTACDSKQSAAKNTDPIILGGDLNTLNKVFDNGYESSGTLISTNVYAQTVTNEKNEEYILIVKVPWELMDSLEAIDFLAEDAQKQYLDLIGDIEFTDVLNTADIMPGQDYLDTYKGTTIAEFEIYGAQLSGYAGGDGEYTFFFDDDRFSYNITLEEGTKIEDYDDTDLFNAAIQDLKIGTIECTGLTSIFVQEFVDKFLDPPEPILPEEIGEAKASLDEINEAIGSNIKAVPGATEEKYSVIDGKIAQYIYVFDDYYYCIRSSADTDIDLASDDFEEYPLVNQDGYVTIVTSETDATHSVRFVFNDYQYAYIVYDNGEFDYMRFDALKEEYKNAICEYDENSAISLLLGEYSSDDNYAMSGIPVSSDSVQVTVYTYDDTQTQLWTMVVKENAGALSYDKSICEIYPREMDSESESSEAGAGVFTIEGATIIWENRIFQ